MTVVVVGNACLDTTFRLRRLPRPGETINALSTQADLGGKGLNQAVAARRAGASVRLWAAVGADAAGEAVARRLRDEGIPDTDLEPLDQPTDRSVLAVDSSGENLILSDVACARRFDPSDKAARVWTAADTILLQGNLRPETTARLIALAPRVLYNASPLGGGEGALGVALLIVNRQEARTLGGHETPAEAAAALRARGAQAVVVTLGAEGALIADETGAHAIPGRPVTALDTSGAGDVFAGVLAAGLDRSLSLIEAAAWANQAAALATTRAGALAACPSAAEIAALLPPRPRS